MEARGACCPVTPLVDERCDDLTGCFVFVGMTDCDRRACRAACGLSGGVDLYCCPVGCTCEAPHSPSEEAGCGVFRMSRRDAHSNHGDGCRDAVREGIRCVERPGFA